MKILINSYEISKSTLAIIPIDSFSSQVIEEDDNFIISKNSTKIIDDSCKFFGSSLDGRHEGTKNLIGVNYKSPIIIEETNEIIFFPTNSPRLTECTWISLNNLEDYKKEDGKTKISFKNGKTISVDVSYNSLDNQVLRSTRLESILRKRKNI